MNGINDIYKYNSVDVALYIVAYANKESVSINLTKTQKLLYIAYGAHLALNDDRLCNEHPQAWPYGPVFPTTRNKLLRTDLCGVRMEDSKLKDDKYLKSLIKFVFMGFGKKTAGYLTTWSHLPNSPWDRTTHCSDFKWGVEIPDEYIRTYFSSLIRE